MNNLQERLESQLDSVIDSVERSHNGIQPFHWFRLAAVAVRCLVMIASALWDKEA